MTLALVQTLQDMPPEISYDEHPSGAKRWRCSCGQQGAGYSGCAEELAKKHLRAWHGIETDVGPVKQLSFDLLPPRKERK